MTEFLAMNGHGAYVWSAYGISLAALVGIGAWPLFAMRTMIRRMKRRARRPSQTSQ